MASDLQKKSKQVNGVETHSIAEQKQSDSSADSNSSPFTPEQRQILGNVYQLIMGWRRERLMKAKQPVPVAQPTEREA